MILNKGDYSSSHQEAKFELHRKPDFETESVRMWVASDEEKKKMKEKGSFIKHKGYKFRLIGFIVVKKKGKVVFACKVKDETKVVMAYLDDKDKIMREAHDELKKYFESMGYEFRDVREIFDEILLEKNTMKYLREKADSLALNGGD